MELYWTPDSQSYAIETVYPGGTLCHIVQVPPSAGDMESF